MPYFQQNLTTAVIMGPMLTSAGVPSTIGTTATITLFVSKNGGTFTSQNTTALTFASSFGYWSVSLSSGSVDTIGRIAFHLRFTTANIGMNWLEWGDVLSSAQYALFYGTSGIDQAVWQATTRTLTSAGIISSAVWAETSRLLTSAATVWSASSRDLSTYAALSSAIWTFTSRSLTSNLTSWGASDVWGYSTRNLTSFGVTLGADVWAVTTKAVTAIPAGYSTMVAGDVWSVAARTLTSADAVWSASSRTLTSTPVSTWGASDVWGYSARTLTSAGIVWSQPLESTLTYENAMRGLSAAVMGESTGGGTTSVKFRNFNGTTVSTVDRLTYDVSTVGNRVLTGFSW